MIDRCSIHSHLLVVVISDMDWKHVVVSFEAIHVHLEATNMNLYYIYAWSSGVSAIEQIVERCVDASLTVMKWCNHVRIVDAWSSGVSATEQIVPSQQRRMLALFSCINSPCRNDVMRLFVASFYS
jgi:hypothetical protein